MNVRRGFSSKNLLSYINNKNYSQSNFYPIGDNDKVEESDYNYLISDYGNFNFDRQKLKKLKIDKISKSILNCNHQILKLTEGNFEVSIESDNISSLNNISLMNLSNVLSINTLSNEDNHLIYETNDDPINRYTEYITIKSNIINSGNISKLSIKSNDEDNYNKINREYCDELLCGLNNKEYETIVFLFEIFFIILWSKDFLLDNNDACLILIIEINDDYTNKEKIFLKASNHENNKFIPFYKKNPINQVKFKKIIYYLINLMF